MICMNLMKKNTSHKLSLMTNVVCENLCHLFNHQFKSEVNGKNYQTDSESDSDDALSVHSAKVQAKYVAEERVQQLSAGRTINSRQLVLPIDNSAINGANFEGMLVTEYFCTL